MLGACGGQTLAEVIHWLPLSGNALTDRFNWIISSTRLCVHLLSQSGSGMAPVAIESLIPALLLFLLSRSHSCVRFGHDNVLKLFFPFVSPSPEFTVARVRKISSFTCTL